MRIKVTKPFVYIECGNTNGVVQLGLLIVLKVSNTLFASLTLFHAYFTFFKMKIKCAGARTGET